MTRMSNLSELFDEEQQAAHLQHLSKVTISTAPCCCEKNYLRLVQPEIRSQMQLLLTDVFITMA